MLGAPDYTGFIRNRHGIRAFIAYQGPDTETCPTITNNIEYLKAKHIVNYILYKDSNGEWTGWGDEFGFFQLNNNSISLSDGLFKAFALKIILKLKE